MLLSIRAEWPEKAGFSIDRPVGLDAYTFLHFLTEMKIEINGIVLTVPAGACIIFSPNTPQHFWSQKDMRHNWFHTSADFKRLLEKYSIPENALLYPSNHESISQYIFHLENEFFGDEQYRQDKIDALLNVFLITFSRLISNNKMVAVNMKEVEELRKVRNLIFTRIDHSWTVEEMAELCMISQSRFYTKYKQVFGISPMNDLINARIDSAKNKLLFSKEKVSKIALALGYTNEYHFIRQFRQYVGISPGKYRKLHCNRCL